MALAHIMAQVRSSKRPSKKRRRPATMGRFPNLNSYRVQIGWEISDLVAALNDAGPSERSIRRLEAGYSIRLTSVYRVFNLLNGKLNKKLDPKVEIQEV
jgi:hypothetical protein